ncbi:MAG: hypothetical protein ABSB74_17970 [Tepidisphaeraceae bacterium]
MPQPRKRRPKVPEQIAAQVLMISKRRCCVCWKLHGNNTVVKGQIAHLDHNRENNATENLVFLCLSHHDEYDGKTSQSRGLMRAEVTALRDELYATLQRNGPMTEAKPANNAEARENPVDVAVAIADRVRKVAQRFETFANAILAHPEPYPWHLWGTDSDNLTIEAGRFLMKAIEAGPLDIVGIRDYPSYVGARIEGNEVPGHFSALFERVLYTLNLDPEQRPSAYDMHLRMWEEDDPARERLEARAFAELQRRRAEALTEIAKNIEQASPNRRGDGTATQVEKK